MSTRTPFENEAVTGTHQYAVDTASSVLRSGGNAYDAAVAAAFVLYVVEPHHNGPGGEVVGIFYDASVSQTFTLCGQGPMPLAATTDAYAAAGLDQIPASGLMAAVVPGAVGAWLTLLKDWGTWGIEKVLAPAIHHAEAGVPLHSRAADVLDGLGGFFRDHWPTSATAYLGPNSQIGPGATFKNPQLASTLRGMSDTARRSRLSRAAGIDAALHYFYEGPVAEEIDRFARLPHLDASGHLNKGLLRADDLSRHMTFIDPCVTAEFDGLTIHKPGPWSQLAFKP